MVCTHTGSVASVVFFSLPQLAQERRSSRRSSANVKWTLADLSSSWFIARNY